MNRGKNSPASHRKRRAYCACGHWQSNHEGHCLICGCEGFSEAQDNLAHELLYVGPRAALRKSKGARPEA